MPAPEREMTDLLAYARELEAEDAALARAVVEIDAVRSAAVEVRSQAEHAVAFLARLPEARALAANAVADARSELERRQSELSEAEAELERAGKEEAVLAARRRVVRTRDLASGAERKLERLEAEAGALEDEARGIEVGLPELGREAAELAAAVEGVSRAPAIGPPQPGPDGVAAWAARAEAALFVARSGLETERERVIRQANELGASALGESLSSSTVSLVRERLERQG